MSVEASIANGTVPEAGPSKVTVTGATDALKPPRKQNHRQRNAPLPRLTSDQLRQRLLYISSGSTVVLRLPSGRTKSAEIHPGRQVSLGKFGSFQADDIIGMPYGFTYEIKAPVSQSTSDETGPAIDDGTSSRSTLSLVMKSTLSTLEAEEGTGATNEHINDDGLAQKLTYIDIQQLKDQGMSGREIIEQQLASSDSYGNRTVYSQAKYVARKEQKHLKLFTPLQPEFGNICDFWFEKSPEKIRWIRKDALAQCLTYASVRPGGKYLVIDGISGLLAGAVLERMGGDGTLIAINDAESPPAFDILPYFHFPAQLTKQVLKVMNWAATEESYAPVFSTQTIERSSASSDAPVNANKSSKDKSRDRKRQAGFREVDSVRTEFFQGDFDAILIACLYDPFSILSRIRDKLAGSASVVVHSPYLQPLVEAHARLRSEEDFINVSITEPWLRKYQVLPGRTHPEMTTSSTGGFILHALKVHSETKALEMRAQYLAHLSEADGKEAEDTESEGPDQKRVKLTNSDALPVPSIES